MANSLGGGEVSKHGICSKMEYNQWLPTDVKRHLSWVLISLTPVDPTACLSNLCAVMRLTFCPRSLHASPVPICGPGFSYRPSGHKSWEMLAFTEAAIVSV